MISPRHLQLKEIHTLHEEGIKGGIWADETRVGTAIDNSRWIIKYGTSEQSDEVVAYQLAQKFFDGVVPETHLIELEGLLASAQRMVTGKSAHDLEAEGTLYAAVRQPLVIPDLANMVIMDFMIGNPDRHGNNWFVMNNGRIAAIDNGFAANELDMPITRALRPVYKCLMDDDCARTPTLIASMHSIMGRLEGKELEAEQIVFDYSISPQHMFMGRWQPRVEELRKRLNQWSRELDAHCSS